MGNINLGQSSKRKFPQKPKAPAGKVMFEGVGVWDGDDAPKNMWKAIVRYLQFWKK